MGANYLRRQMGCVGSRTAGSLITTTNCVRADSFHRHADAIVCHGLPLAGGTRPMGLVGMVVHRFDRHQAAEHILCATAGGDVGVAKSSTPPQTPPRIQGGAYSVHHLYAPWWAAGVGMGWAADDAGGNQFLGIGTGLLYTN